MEKMLRSEASGDGRDVSASAMLLVFVLVAAATSVHWGAFKWRALFLLMCAVGMCVWVHLRPRAVSVSVEGILIALVVVFLGTIAHMNAGQNEVFERYVVPGVSHPWKQVNVYGRSIRFLSAVGMVLSLTYVAGRWEGNRRWVRLRFLLLVLIAVAFRPLMLKSTPVPRIDVYVSQTLGAKGLLLQLSPPSEREKLLAAYTRANDLGLTRDSYVRPDGREEKYQAWALRRSRDVYEMYFPRPDWYEGRRVPLLDEGGRLREVELGPRVDREGNPVKGAWIDHYGYPPETVYANALSWWAFKDVRSVWLLCDLLGALCIYVVGRRMSGDGRGGRFCELTMLAFLFLPRSLFVLEQSWTEPLCVATLGGLAVALTRRTHRLWRGILMGLFLSSKQYVVLAALPLLRLRRCRLAEWVVAAVAGVLLVIPFAVWNWGALFHDVLGFFLKSEIRPDALSVAGGLKRFGIELPWWAVTPLWLGGLGFFTWKMKRTLAGMLFSTASIWLFFFLLGKQAFMNYWYLIMYALLLGVAATGGKDGE